MCLLILILTHLDVKQEVTILPHAVEWINNT